MWASEKEIEKFAVQQGDLLICEGGEVGRSVLLDEISDVCIIQNALHRVRAKEKSSVKYLQYFMQHVSNARWFDILCNKATIAHLTGEKLASLELPLPPVSEQQAIANFLDRKTAQIDELIAKKEALLKQLDEKRTVLIIQAVTKGIDTSVSMKDSGVVWLGKIPEHWEVKRLKFVSIVQPSNVDKKTSDGEFPVLLCNYSDVYNNFEIDSTLDFMQATATQEEIGKFHLSEGDVIVTKDSETPYDIAVPAYIGKSFNDVLCGYHLTQIRPKEMFGKYLFRLFQSTQFNAQFIVRANGVTRFGLPQYVINNAFIIKPPLEEQQAISQYIDKKTATIDRQKAQVVEAIERLKEYRTAMITDAVTGKIDVHATIISESKSA